VARSDSAPASGLWREPSPLCASGSRALVEQHHTTRSPVPRPGTGEGPDPRVGWGERRGHRAKPATGDKGNRESGVGTGRDGLTPHSRELGVRGPTPPHERAPGPPGPSPQTLRSREAQVIRRGKGAEEKVKVAAPEVGGPEH
jgi:hypothetical protein